MRRAQSLTTVQPSRRWGRVLGGFFGLFALGGAPIAPGCSTQLAECSFDSDCDQGQACEASNCVMVCGTDADCVDGEVCLEGSTTPSQICGVPEDPEDRAVLVETTIALIRDASVDGCEGGAPGADIAFVLLEDASGEIEAWGDIVAAQVGDEGNGFAQTAHIDGRAPEWGADSCPELRDESVVSLGCGGSIAVRFADENGNDVSLQRGAHRIRVGERGAQCEDFAADTYDLFLCPGATFGDDVPEACGVEVGAQGAGERVFEL